MDFAGALQETHMDESRFHAHAIGQLQERYNRPCVCLNAMCVDKLDGRVDDGFFERKSKEWRSEQDRVQRNIGWHQTAGEACIEEGVRVLELAARTHELFIQQDPREERRVLNFLVSNCTWANRELRAEFRQPFDMLAVAAAFHKEKKAAGAISSELPALWYPMCDTFRTLCFAPDAEMRELFEAAQGLLGA